jgi:hypothetical protein
MCGAVGLGEKPPHKNTTNKKKTKNKKICVGPLFREIRSADFPKQLNPSPTPLRGIFRHIPVFLISTGRWRVQTGFPRRRVGTRTNLNPGWH